MFQKEKRKSPFGLLSKIETNREVSNLGGRYLEYGGKLSRRELGGTYDESTYTDLRQGWGGEKEMRFVTDEIFFL